MTDFIWPAVHHGRLRDEGPVARQREAARRGDWRAVLDQFTGDAWDDQDLIAGVEFDVDEEDTILHVAARSGAPEEVLGALVEAGCPRCVRNVDELTAAELGAPQLEWEEPDNTEEILAVQRHLHDFIAEEIAARGEFLRTRYGYGAQDLRLPQLLVLWETGLQSGYCALPGFSAGVEFTVLGAGRPRLRARLQPGPDDGRATEITPAGRTPTEPDYG